MIQSDFKPLVSVCVCTYNQASTIAQTIESILTQQTSYSYEIVIGEDASNFDNTRTICEQYASQYPSIITLLPKSSNKGLIKNFIDCLHVCKGTYIGVCAGDDWWSEPQKIQIQTDFLEANPDYGLVHTDMDKLDINTNTLYPASLKRNPPEGFVNCNLYKCNFINAPTVLFRRELLNDIDFNVFTDQEFVMEDYPMWLVMSRLCKFHYLNISSVTYRVGINSASNKSDFESKMVFIENTVRIQNYYFRKFQPKGITSEQMIIWQNRARYLTALNYKEYYKSFQYVDDLKFNILMCFFLKTIVGAFLCRLIINSSIYKRLKNA